MKKKRMVKQAKEKLSMNLKSRKMKSKNLLMVI
jgi:hypothetical protein